MMSACCTISGLSERDSKKRFGSSRMAHADVAIGVDDAFVGEDAVGDDHVGKCAFQIGHFDIPCNVPVRS